MKLLNKYKIVMLLLNNIIQLKMNYKINFIIFTNHLKLINYNLCNKIKLIN